MSAFLSVQLFVCPSDFHSLCLSISPRLSLSVMLSIFVSLRIYFRDYHSVYYFVSFSIWMCGCMFIYPSVSLPLYLSVCLSTCRFYCLSVRPSVRPSVCLYLSTYLSICNVSLSPCYIIGIWMTNIAQFRPLWYHKYLKTVKISELTRGRRSIQKQILCIELT